MPLDKYAPVTDDVFNCISIAKGISAKEIIDMFPQHNEGLINRALYRLVQEHKIYIAASLTPPLYFIEELPF